MLAQLEPSWPMTIKLPNAWHVNVPKPVAVDDDEELEEEDADLLPEDQQTFVTDDEFDEEDFDDDFDDDFEEDTDDIDLPDEDAEPIPAENVDEEAGIDEDDQL